MTVRFGGALGVAAGVARETVELEAGATVADLLSVLGRTHIALEAGLDSTLTVTRGVHVSGEAILADRDEVSLLLPVSGG